VAVRFSSQELPENQSAEANKAQIPRLRLTMASIEEKGGSNPAATVPSNEKITTEAGYDETVSSVRGNTDSLQRHLGNRQIQMIAIGGSIGTALFVSIGNGLIDGGPGSLLLAYTIYTCLLGLVNNCMAEMTVFMPISGITRPSTPAFFFFFFLSFSSSGFLIYFFDVPRKGERRACALPISGLVLVSNANVGKGLCANSHSRLLYSLCWEMGRRGLWFHEWLELLPLRSGHDTL
jgi:hypothetical protein